MLPIKFWFIWQSGFRGEYFQKSTKEKPELPLVAMFVNGSGQKVQSLQRTFHRCFLPSFGSFGKAISEENIFLRNQPIRNKNCLWRPCFLMDWGEISLRNGGLSIDASYQVSIHLDNWFQGRQNLKNQPIRNKNRLWQPCLLTYRDEMSSLYREPSIDASY